MQKFINPTQLLKSMTWTKPLYGKAIITRKKIDRGGPSLLGYAAGGAGGAIAWGSYGDGKITTIWI